MKGLNNILIPNSFSLNCKTTNIRLLYLKDVQYFQCSPYLLQFVLTFTISSLNSFKYLLNLKFYVGLFKQQKKMNVARKIFFSYPQYNNNFPPCRLDICSCLMNHNLQSSYTDRFNYKKCYDRVESFFMKKSKRVELMFDEGASKLLSEH